MADHTHQPHSPEHSHPRPLPSQQRVMAPSLCWACRRTVQNEHFCPECAKVQPLSSGVNHFDLLDLPILLNLNEKELEERYYELSRQLHPDYFKQQTNTEQGHSLERSAAINKAYRTLRSLESRARYLLELYRQRPLDDPERVAAPKSLLMTVFEMQSAIEELAELPAGAPAAQLEAARHKLNEVREQLDSMRMTQLARLQRLADEWDAMSGCDPAADQINSVLDRLKSLLDEMTYLDRLYVNIAQALGEAA